MEGKDKGMKGASDRDLPHFWPQVHDHQFITRYKNSFARDHLTAWNPESLGCVVVIRKHESWVDVFMVGPELGPQGPRDSDVFF